MKKRITALALAFVMVLGMVAVAAGADKAITVTPMTLTINGQQVTPSKSNGADAEVFAYDGATYVPLRYLAELLNLNVEWDPSNPGVASVTGDVTLSAGGDGTYTGTAQGFGGTITATITVSGGKVTVCTLVGDKETAAIGGAALPKLEAQVIAAGSADIDGVSGATMTSGGVKAAVADALSKATGATAAAVKMKPGTYSGSGAGFREYWTIDAKVTVSETEILSIDVDKNSADTVGVFPTAVDLLVPRMIANQSVAVDSITGATASSNGIKTAVTNALKEALKAGGSDESAINAFRTIPAKSSAKETLHTTVLVVGMGGAGTMAALRAAEEMYAKDPSSVDVLAIDKAGRYGGTSSLTADFMAINPKKFKAEYNNGKDYVDAEYLKKDWREYTLGDAKEEMIDLFIDKSGDTLDWMVYDHDLHLAPPTGGLTEGDNMVVKFQYAPNNQGLTVRRTANLAFYDGCVKSYTDMGGKYMLETTGYDYIYDKATNTVKGVKARNDNGTEYEIYADAVIIATGGFAGNAEMEEKYLKNDYYPLKGAWSQCGMTFCEGEMLQSAIDLGAATYSIGMCPVVHLVATPSFLTQFEFHQEDSIQTATNKPLVWTEGDLPMYLGLASNSLAVSTTGERLTNESNIGFNAWKSGSTFYSIYSGSQIQNVADNGLKFPIAGAADRNFGACGNIPAATPIPNAFEVMDAAVEAGIATKADTLEELADKLGMKPATLKATVDTYNGYCKTGVDQQFGKKAESLDAVEGGPYYAITMRSYCYCTCAGLDVNEQLQVLDTSGKTINGLYAAGNDCSGVLYSEQKPYVTYGGAAQGWCYTSGRLAAEAAVANLNK